MDHASNNRFIKASDHPWNASGPVTVTQPQVQTHTFSHSSPSPIIAQPTSVPASASRSRHISPHAEGPQGETSNMQRAAGSSEPSNERVKLTKTGRISKAKKGMRVHNCETCGKRYTRAEHLRRHQLNHSTGSLRCDFAGCNKTFHREDLLSRHRERHLENQVGQSSRGSPQSQSSPEASAPSGYDSLPVSTASASPSKLAVSTSSWYSSTAGSTASYVSAPNVPKNTDYPPYRSLPLVSQAPVDITWEQPSGSLIQSDTWIHSPPYSSSSGYGSPNYGNLTLSFAGQHPAQLQDRQRSFSNPSLIPQFPSQQITTTKFHPSPTPSIIAPYWDWDIEPQGREYSISSAPAIHDSRSTSVTRTPSLAPNTLNLLPFDVNAMAFIPRDTLEEAEFEFQQEDAISEQYLDQYWEFSHPQFPVLHRPTFFLSTVPPLLKAAVLAIGSQYSLDWNAKQYSRKLYEQCLKTLAKRVQDGYESKRVHDMQATFLVEVYTQYMNRRTPTALSSRFKDLYHILSFDTSISSAMPLECIINVQPQTDDFALPPEWIPQTELLKFMHKRRLLALCYVLDSQKRYLFPQTPDQNYPSGLDLPFICSTEQWDTATPEELVRWSDTAEFPWVSEILNQTSAINTPNSEPFDTFRSALLIAAAKETEPSLLEPSLLDPSRLAPASSTQLLYLVNLLSHHVPLRALLAVAGETWVMGEKIATNDEYQALRAELRTWTTNQGLANNNIAVDTALRILRLELNRPPAESRNSTLIEQWAIYLAVLVLWATAYTVQFPPRNPNVLSSQKAPSFGDAQIPVHSTLGAVEQGRWKDVVAGNGVMGVLNWVRGKINGSSNGLVVEAVLVLGKLVGRGSEESWF